MVLSENAGRSMTVKEIHEKLQSLANQPSLDTIKRIFPSEKELLERLFPGKVVESGTPSVQRVYLSGDELHVVLETPDGQVLQKGGIDLEAEIPPFSAPSLSTVDNILKDITSTGNDSLLELKTFPLQLRCYTKRGDTTISYKALQAELLEENQETKNNRTRYYELRSRLSPAEWRILFDLIDGYAFFTDEQTKSFQGLLESLVSGNPKPVGWQLHRPNKQGNEAIFRNIERLDNAIRRKKKVNLTYGGYELQHVNGHLTPVLVRREIRGRKKLESFEPHTLMWSNGSYYLVGRDEGIMHLRVDRILDVEVLDEPFTPEPPKDPSVYRTSNSMMYVGKEEFVHLRCVDDMQTLRLLVDQFGSAAQYRKADGMVEVTMKTALEGVKRFALQNVERIEVLAPKELREEIARELKNAVQKYR